LGVAIVALQGGKYRFVLQATKLPSLPRDQAYEVWLYNSRGDAKSLGAQGLADDGTFSGQSDNVTRAELDKYRFVDLSREPIDENAAHSGQSVLRGRLSKPPPDSAKQGQTTIVARALLRPPGS
jgi:hypothetical protein